MSKKKLPSIATTEVIDRYATVKCFYHIQYNRETKTSVSSSLTSLLQCHLLPLRPSVLFKGRYAKISILKYEWNIEKYFYERRVYESVEDSSLSYVISRISMKNKIWFLKG